MYVAIVGWHIQEYILKDKKTVKIAEKNIWGYMTRLLGQVQTSTFIIP